jgi:dTMP kinase
MLAVFAGSREVDYRGLALEGGEGAGKSTQGGLLVEHLRARGREVIWTREPGGTPASEAIREIVLSPQFEGLDPRAEALLFAAARGEHAARVIRPAVERGAVVVCDRYIDSSVAYQGYGREQDLAELKRINDWAIGGLWPELVIYIEVPTAILIERMKKRELDRFEREDSEFFKRVADGFSQMAAADPKRWLIIDGTPDKDDLEKIISSRVQERLGI